MQLSPLRCPWQPDFYLHVHLNFSALYSTEPKDTALPVLTVLEDIVVEASTANGDTEVTFTITAEYDVDGTATLEEDGTTKPYKMTLKEKLPSHVNRLLAPNSQ